MLKKKNLTIPESDGQISTRDDFWGAQPKAFNKTGSHD